jgi:two-component system cell cycle response regulator
MWFVASRLEKYMGSFKFRLAAYFLLLSMLPLLGAVWAFSEVATRSEIGRADARLNAALRVAVDDFGTRVEQATQTAKSLARATGFQEALAESNRGGLVRLYREVGNAAFYAKGQLIAGSAPPPLSVRRSATVIDSNGVPLGKVVAFVALDDELVAALRARPGFARDDRLALVGEGRTIVGPAGLERLTHPLTVRDVEFDGERQRMLATRLSKGGPDATLVVYTSKASIEAQAADLRRRMLALAALALGIAAIMAYVLGRTIVRSLKQLADAAGAIARGNFSSRVPVKGRDEFAALGRAFNDMAGQLESRLEELAWERARTRDAIARFGEALSATHNPYQLVPVVLESMVEATGAVGGRLIVAGDELAVAGDPEAGGRPLAIPLGDDHGETGLLLLTPPTTDFSDDARELAYWLANQARTALENASMHKRLEHEAVTDGLTALPNRRQFEEKLEAELVRVHRLGGTLAVIVGDLDDFKQVNDRYGHLAGDDVLRAFADVLRAEVREIDTAARYGGEEFALLLPGTNLAGAHHVADRIRVAMETRPIETFRGAPVTVTVSFGVAAYPDSPTADALFAAADEALYRAKAAGKNAVAVSGGSRPSAAAVRPGA